ncbi:unnamed protein product [Amoebophrya sp. A120]|nr:unnamed protein product [Amoebophrya sp. A120]|eukprot:GSA120T00009379001.1
MSSACSSSSAAGPSGNGPADPQLANQPTKITVDNVLIRYKGSYEKWGQKIADLDRNLLEGRLRNLDQRTVNKMLASQVNIWYVLATRHLKFSARPALPEPIRRLVIQFIRGSEDGGPLVNLRGAGVNPDAVTWCRLVPVATERITGDYSAVLRCYLEKIQSAAKAGSFDNFLITEEVANSVPALTNGDRPRMDIIASMLVQKDFELRRQDGTRIRSGLTGAEDIGDVSLPLRIDLSCGTFGHADRNAATIARAAVELSGTAGPRAGTRGEDGGGAAWKSFSAAVTRTRQQVAEYLLKLLTKSAAEGEPELVVTSEVMAQAPKLPSGKDAPLTPEQTKALHRNLHRVGVLWELTVRQDTDGFTIRYREGRNWTSGGEPLPFTLQVGYFPHDDHSSDEEEGEEAQGEDE